MTLEKKKPLRFCKGCNKSFPKNQLLRVVRSPDGIVSFDPHGKAPGRGIYLCKNLDCILMSKKTRRLERELHTPIPDEIFQQLLVVIQNENGTNCS